MTAPSEKCWRPYGKARTSPFDAAGSTLTRLCLPIGPRWSATYLAPPAGLVLSSPTEE
jgi:hypothetical protein